MFENVASDILGKLNEPEITKAYQAKDGPYLQAVDSLKKARSLNGLFDALSSLDKLVCARIGGHLKEYKLDVPIKKQPGLSKYPITQGDFLLGAYLQVLSDPIAARAVTEVVTTHLGPPADKFPYSQRKTDQDQTVLPFLLAARQMVILSLAVGMNSGATQVLFNLFRNVKHATVGMSYKDAPGSLLATAASAACYCVSVRPTSEPATLRERYAEVVSGNGGPSELGFPVWLADQRKDRDRLDTPFKFITVEDARRQCLSGSLSFTAGEVPYYSPPRFDILHELIHVLHNASGENRQSAGDGTPSEMTTDERAVWTNPEEYWTIEGGPLTENHMNPLIGLPPRHGHSGVPLWCLKPEAKLAQFTLREIALGHAPSPDA